MRNAFVLVTLVLVALAPGCGKYEPSTDTAELLDRIKAEGAAASADLIEIRRQIHMNPELSGQEEKTAALVAENLTALGLEVETGVGGHGVVGVLRGGRPGPIVAYRADMDAVTTPIVGDPPYRSRVEGVKHVCGHDAHVAVGIGVARALAAIRDDLPGTVKFIFQPAEENVEGAQAMIDAGVLENPAPEAIFAVHTGPFQVGTIACPEGVGLTGWDAFSVRIETQENLDAIEGEVAGALQALSTVAPPTTEEEFATVIANMMVENGPFEDFILVLLTGATRPDGEPGVSVLEGMVRAAGPPHYERARARIEETLGTLGEETTRFEITFADKRFPDMHSDPGLVRAAIAPIEAALGEGSATPMLASAPFFGEDFALFQKHMPGAMFFLGMANAEKGITALNHMPDYDIDESALEIGTVAMANVLLDYMVEH